MTNFFISKEKNEVEVPDIETDLITKSAALFIWPVSSNHTKSKENR